MCRLVREMAKKGYGFESISDKEVKENHPHMPPISKSVYCREHKDWHNFSGVGRPLPKKSGVD